MRSGQALVMVLLIMGIALTVGLSIISRSVNEVSVSTTADEANRALEAAEEGVQRSLAGVIAGNSGIVIDSTNSRVQVRNQSIAGAPDVPYEVPFRLSSGEAVSLDLNGYTGGDVGICWGDATLNPLPTPPGIEVIVYYRSGGSERVGRDGFREGGGDGLTDPNNAVDCNPLQASQYLSSHRLLLNPLTGGGQPLLMRVKILYADQPQTVKFWPASGQGFVDQGRDVISTGQTGSATQKLRVVQTTADLPTMFDSALFSGVRLVK